ncbi:DoxX family protein [Crossiella sp. CA-258035]|uniref:DoxX family protein n=1 Tax=Crossiella sp. CA-258035 TaxID=2981138 RepID=UPI0024BBEC5D|nr:DoxX family protein [Crossiella sp. CA-258035]WHT18158.1 DoxX family protein [Crossiella sp. CA-258035]
MSTHDSGPGTSGGAHHFDDAGHSATGTTAALPVDQADGADTVRRKPFAWNGGTDLGLLVLRLVLGGTFIAHGAQKLFGVFNGPGINGFAKFLESFGFQQTRILAYVTGITELGGGLLVLLGFLTPLGAAGLLGVMINVVTLKWNNGFFLGQTGSGFEFDLVLGALAAALLFLGPGRAAVDNGRAWARVPLPWGVLFLLVAAGSAVITLVVLR